MSINQKILLTCKEATLLISKRQHNATTLKEKFQLQLHLLVCKVCSLFNKQSNLLHKHMTEVHGNDQELHFLELDASKKSNLQSHINSELEK